MSVTIDDYIEDVTPALVIVPNDLGNKLDTMLDAEIAKWPDAEKDRETLRGQLIAFFSKYGYLPEFSLAPRLT